MRNTAAADTDLLARFLDLLAPIQREAERRVWPADLWASVRVYLSPFRVDVAFMDADARQRRLWRAPGDLELADVTARFLTAALARLPEPERTTTAKILADGTAEAVVLADARAGHASAALVPKDDEAEPVALVTLTSQPTLH